MDQDFVCFCEGITEKEIKENIKKGIKTVDEMCKKTKTGTHCSSCKPRIQKLLDQAAAK